MAKTSKAVMMEHLAKWADECGIDSGNAEVYLSLLRTLENNGDIYHIENILKTTITLMKRHMDKLKDVSDTDIRVALQPKS